jgi:hypothetical protein
MTDLSNSTPGAGVSASMLSRFFCFFSLYFGIGFASPLLVILANRDDIGFGPLAFSAVSLAIILALSFLSLYLSSKTSFARVLATAALACAFVLAIQGNVVHDLFYYGAFNGERVDWRQQYGWEFWAEWIGWLLAFPLFYWLLSRLPKLPALLAVVPVLSSLLLVVPALVNQKNPAPMGLVDDKVSTDVFDFSSKLNLVHLLPDGFQEDFARQVLDEHPELAAKLSGFTLFGNNVGMYQATAPAVPTMFTGRPFDLNDGYKPQRIVDKLERYAYPERLRAAGFRLDFLTISPMFCLPGASTCVVRPFNDLKPRGYFRYKDMRISYGLRLVADLTLFRHAPMFLKERIYNGGDWLFSNTTLDGSSPWPDPVLREWTEHMVVDGDQPRYKWYHYIGTHIPPHWDGNCVFHHDLERTRKQYHDQALCILKGIARFADRLRQLGIYDKTAIVITGDHGVNIMPDDIKGTRANGSMHEGVLGGSRPAFMIKPLNDGAPFKVSDLPTYFLDIAPTALDLVGLKGDYEGQPVSRIDPEANRPRYFRRFYSSQFWDGKPISYVTWKVDGPVQNLGDWSLQDWFYRYTAPSEYPAINFNTAFETSRGLSLNRAKPDVEYAWIGGSEFSILLGTDHPAKPAVVEMKLIMPDFMDEDTQTFTLEINHQALPETYSLQKSEDWTAFKIPVPDGVLHKGNNLLTVRFAHTAQPKTTKDWHTAGKLKSLGLVQ